MTSPVVPFLDLGATYRELKEDLDRAYQRVMTSGWYLLGTELAAFEAEFASYTEAADCAGVASGLDALVLSLRALGVDRGGEVIVPSNTYIATWLAVSALGAIPVPVEPDEATFNLTGEAIEAAITHRTAAILPVHLYGLPADISSIQKVSARYGIPVIYDAAQAHGARYDGHTLGGYGDLVAWSFYPGKNLGAYADAGAVTGRDPELLARVRRLRNYGSETKYVNQERGVNSRMDELQAAVLSVKLRHLDQWNDRRRATARTYLSALVDSGLALPAEPDARTSAWHLFVVRSDHRDALQAHLRQDGIQSLIHYPLMPHRQEAYSDHDFPPLPVAEAIGDQVLSLPIGPHLSQEHNAHVIKSIRVFTSHSSRYTALG